MLLNAKRKFLLEKAKHKGAEALFAGFLSTAKKTGNQVCDESVEYLKLFVQYHYNDCIKIMRSLTRDPFSSNPYESDYILLIQLIAIYYADRNDAINSLLWSMKAIELYDILYPTLDPLERETIQLDLYVTEIFGKYYKRYPISDMYDEFFLDWELKQGLHLGHKIISNDN